MKYLTLDTGSAKHGDFIFREIRMALERMGHQTARVSVFNEKEPITDLKLSMILDIEQPDRIMWHGGVGYPHRKLWDRDPWNKIPKIVLNYDEPFLRFIATPFESAWAESGKRDDYFIGIWDGYWRDRAKAKWGINSFPCHLASNEFEHVKRFDIVTHGIVFYGMLQSIQKIQNAYSILPSNLQRLVKKIDDILNDNVSLASQRINAMVPRPGEEAIEMFAEGDEVAEAGQLPQRILRWCVWALSKNAIRVRILRTVLRRHKVTMFCDTKQLDHASPAELAMLLPDCIANLKIVDTSNWSSEQVAEIPNHGDFHLQITDPQSVQGGIPYRVFQTAACGKSLITDSRPELEQAFKLGVEFDSYKPEGTNVLHAIEDCLMFDGACRYRGTLAQERFLKEHTWAHRIAEMEGWIASRKLQEVPV